MALNPFIWDRPLDDPTKIVGMDDFAREVALTLKAQTNVAIFGPRDTGKSTFLTSLSRELELEHEADAPPFEMIRINLKRAVSIPAFISCVDDALREHPKTAVRIAAQKELELVERQLEINFKIFKTSAKRSKSQIEPAEALHAQLKTLPRITDRLVICFDEFQRLNRCPGEPLAILGSALMDTGVGNVSLLFTGSIREYLEMLLNNSREPIFNQATKKKLPLITRAEFREFLAFHFEATGREIEDEALDHLLELSQTHPKRTQQLAWAAWNRRRRGGDVGTEDVRAAFEDLVEDQQADFAVVADTLASGEEAESTEWKTLQLLADGHSGRLASASVAETYGLGSRTAAPRAAERLERRGLVERRSGNWRIIDPFLAEWLRRNSPFQD